MEEQDSRIDTIQKLFAVIDRHPETIAILWLIGIRIFDADNTEYTINSYNEKTQSIGILDKNKKMAGRYQRNELLNLFSRIRPILSLDSIVKYLGTKDECKRFLTIFKSYIRSDYTYEDIIDDYWQNTHNLNKEDEELIYKWDALVETNDYIYSQMVSARAAEKQVIAFCKKLGYSVEDISIHQITRESEDWKKGDLRLDKKYLLDVKNARTDINSKIYSEFCIPSFKKVRDKEREGGSRDVFIVGVLSPYLQAKFIENLGDPDLEMVLPQVLGITSYSKIEKILKMVGKKTFQDIEIQIELKRSNQEGNFIPPYFFDYQQRFYSEIEKCFSDLNSLHENEIPDLDQLDFLKIDKNNFLSFILSGKKSVSPEIISSFDPWKQDLASQLCAMKSSSRIELPELFLGILKYFILSICGKVHGVRPNKYKSILFISSTTKLSRHPLGVYDPLNIIIDLCDTLSIIWDNKDQHNLEKYKIFRFRGKGLLTAQEDRQSKSVTILAYCGGYISGKGKCGFSPLVIGKHKTCSSCGYLICPVDDCQCCSQSCPEYKVRRIRAPRCNTDLIENDQEIPGVSGSSNSQ